MGWANDFIKAFKTGYELFDNDDKEYKRLRNQVLKSKLRPERLKLEDDVLKRRALGNPLADAAAKRKLDYYDTNNEIAKENLKRLRGEGAAPAGPAADAPVFNPGGERKEITDVGGSRRSAVPVGEGTDEEQLRAQDLAQDEEQDLNEPEPDNDEDDQAYARGGAVRKVRNYANGGAVDPTDPEDEDGDTAEPDDDEDDAAAAPAQSTAQGTSQGNQKTGSHGFSPAAGHDAALAGIKYAMKETGADGDPQTGAVQSDEISTARRQTASRSAYLGRAGAATQDEMDAVRNAIDPQKKMTEGQRNLAALSHVYMWKLKQGDVEGANKSAAAMMQYYGLMSDRYQALAKVAAESGNVDGTVQNMLKAHANIPDGMNLRMVKRGDGSIAYVYQDEQTGKAYEQGVASPDQIVEFATKGMVNMESMIAQAAGARTGGKGGVGGEKATREPKAAKEPAPEKLTDIKAGQDMVNDAFDSVTDNLPGANGEAPKIDPKIASAVKADAYHIFMNPQNRKAGLDPRAAAMIAGNLAIPNPTKPDSRDFQLQTVDGGRLVQLNDGHKAFIPEEQFNRLIVMRGKAQQKLAKPAAKTDPNDELGTSEKPGFIRGAIDAFNRGSADAPPYETVPSTAPVDRARQKVNVRALPIMSGGITSLDDAPPDSIPNRGRGER